MSQFRYAAINILRSSTPHLVLIYKSQSCRPMPSSFLYLFPYANEKTIPHSNLPNSKLRYRSNCHRSSFLSNSVNDVQSICFHQVLQAALSFVDVCQFNCFQNANHSA
ncbi:hypothetical protein M758_5G131800 [Ceratodon purpureus]|nr:hypothetical protein M758_5G131800 [Ceratodon purpureus]